MSSSSSNGVERDLGGDVDKDKQTKPNPKPMPFRRCSIGSRCRIHSNRQSSVVATFYTFSASVATIGVQSSGAKEGGSICLAKYTSWPYLAPSSSRSNATVLIAAL